MTTIAVTPAAAAHLREEIAADRDGRTAIMFIWQGATADLSRGSEGEAVWTRVAPGHWIVIRVNPDELEQVRPRDVSGFSVVADWPEKIAPNAVLTIDYANGELVVI